jgi:predicted ATP-dependent endonuclease of OLD family
MVKIEKVIIDNFLSFKNKQITLRDTNILVGANGVGKTHLLLLIHTTLTNSPQLAKYLAKNRNNASIEIHITFDNIKETVKDLYVLILLHKLMESNQQYLSANIDVNSLLCHDYFKDGLIFKCQYIKGEIKEYITFKNKCYDDCQVNGFIDIYDHDTKCMSKTCPFKNVVCKLKDNLKIRQIIDAAGQENIKQISDILTEIKINETIKFNNLPNELKSVVDTKLFDDQFRTALNKYYIVSDEGRIYIKYPNNDKYFNQHIMGIIKNHDKFDAKNVVEFINKWGNRVENKIHEISHSTIGSCDVGLIIKNFVKNSIGWHGMPVDYNMKEKFGNCQSLTSMFNQRVKKFSADKFYSDMSKIYPHESIRYMLFLIKNNKFKLYKKIKETFYKITGKICDVVEEKTDLIVPDYKYKIIEEDDQLRCSGGECELLDFLTEYFGSECSVILMDEPCTHLSSQSKHVFRDVILKQSYNKQLIVVTHDVELVSHDICKNLLYLSIDKQSTSVIDFSELDEKTTKNIFEHSQVLFSRNILLVEGYHDVRFMKCFLSCIGKAAEFTIISLGGCMNRLWCTLDKLYIPYKVIYDFDVLYQKISKKPNDKDFFGNPSYLLKCILSTFTDIKSVNKYLIDERKNRGDHMYQYDENNESYIAVKKSNKSNKFKQHNTTQFKNETPIDVRLLSNPKNIDKNLELIRLEGRQFIWHNNIYDLEGVGKEIFELDEFRKDKWFEKSSDDIICAIKNFMSKNQHNFLKDLEQFILSDRHLFVSC